MAEICFQKAPGQDLAQKSRFPMIPEGAFNCRPARLSKHHRRLPEGSQKLPTRDPQKAPRRLREAPRALPEGSQKAPRRLSRDPQKAPRSFLKAPRSSQKALKRLSEGSQKFPEAEFNSRPQGLAKAESCWNFTCRPKGSQIAEICLQKAPGQDLAQKGGNFRACPKP